MNTAKLAQVNATELHTVVKADAVELHYQPDSDVVIHKAGCMHRMSQKQAWAGYHVRPFEVPPADTPFNGDWYYVAPCAKKAS